MGRVVVWEGFLEVVIPEVKAPENPHGVGVQSGQVALCEKACGGMEIGSDEPEECIRFVFGG